MNTQSRVSLALGFTVFHQTWSDSRRIGISTPRTADPSFFDYSSRSVSFLLFRLNPEFLQFGFIFLVSDSADSQKKMTITINQRK